MELGDQFYPIRLRRSPRAKSISLSADTIRKEVRISLPRHASEREALHFAQSKSDWLAQRFSEAQQVVPICNGARIAFLGNKYLIHWSPDFKRKPESVEDEIRVGGPEDLLQDRVIRWMKSEARSAYQVDLEHYCALAQCAVPKLSIGDARRRWGSCSSKKAVRLSWRLIMAPPQVRRSVVAHEVAHLKHMNHSKSFYDHLDSIFEGDRKAADRWLKQHGGNLHLIGA